MAKIVSQEVSCIEYEVHNQDYERSTIDCQRDPVQPKLLNGWNEDYKRVDVDRVETTGLSQKFVQQSIYIKSDVDNNPVACNLTCYVRHDKDNSVVTIKVIDNTGITPEPILILAYEDDRDNVIVSEKDILRIALEDNTTITHIDNELDVKRLLTEDNITQVIYETDDLMALE